MTKYQNKVNYQNHNYIFREIEPQEKEKFNNFIYSTSLGNIFQTYEWGKLKSSFGWHPRPIIIEKKGEIIGAITILEHTAGGMTMFYSPRGPILDYKYHPELLRLLPLGITPLAKERKAVFWRIDPELPNGGSGKVTLLLRNNNFKAVNPTNNFGGIQPRWVWRIPLVNDPDTQFSMLKKSARRNIRKALKAGVVIKEGKKEDLSHFYMLLQATAKRNNFLLRGIEYYQQVWQELSTFPGFRLLIAYHQNKPVSTALAIGFGQGIWDIYAGNSEDNRDIGASYLLTWELISWASQKGYSFYDLGGIAPKVNESHPLNGLKIFKSQFGGSAEEFIGEYDLIFNPMAYRLWNLGKYTFEVANDIRKKVGAIKG